MASSDKESKKLPQSPEDQQEAQRATDRVRLELAKLAEVNCEDRAADAFCLFLRVHSCILKSVSSSPRPDMVALNPLFATRFLSVCQDVFGNGGFEHTPRLWFEALYFYYTNTPKHITRSLAMMAEAHILEDLPLSLIELERTTGISIHEDQYRGAFDDIIECLNEMDKGLVKEAKSAEDWLIYALGAHFNVLKSIR